MVVVTTFRLTARKSLTSRKSKRPKRGKLESKKSKSKSKNLEERVTLELILQCLKMTTSQEMKLLKKKSSLSRKSTRDAKTL